MRSSSIASMALSMKYQRVSKRASGGAKAAIIESGMAKTMAKAAASASASEK